MSNSEYTSVNYKGIAYTLLTLVVASVIYIFTTSVAAQNMKNKDQDTQIEQIQATDQKLSENLALLTQLVQSHDAQIKTIQAKR